MNSNELNSPATTNPDLSTPSPTQSSDSKTIAFNEAPLASLPPGVSVLAPDKPLIEMTMTEIQAWHAKLRDHKNFQTMQAHLASISPTTTRKPSAQPKRDMSEFS